MKLRLMMGLLALVAGSVACSHDAADSGPRIESIASALGQQEGNLLWVSKAKLGREFLLQANMVSQTLAPFGGGLRSRVVTFQRKENKLFMMEATEGHTLAPELPTELILASFPIASEDADRIVFDFNDGMSKVFIAADWTAQDFDGTGYAPNFQSIPLGSSFLRATRTDVEKNQFVIDQVAQLNVDLSGVTDSSTIAVKYYLTPYANSDYKAFGSPGLSRVGFFEITPILKPGGAADLFAARFAPNKPIKFAVSDNTPEPYRAAVREGIEYWNQVLTSTKIEVTMAPKSATAPDFDENVVQWIPWDDAGFAYADAQMDPRTGQVLHGQVWLTSSWALFGRDAAQAFVRKFADAKPELPTSKKGAKNARAIGLAGMARPSFCNLSEGMNARIANRMKSVLATNPSDETVLRASQDVIRTVVAHEIGHVLGLRHNFAGSLGANYPFDQEEGILRDYLAHDASLTGDIVSSSSLMDYSTVAADMLIGDRIEKRRGILPYDGAAIDILYNGRRLKKDQIPTFCTDTQQMADCTTFDGGRSIVEMSHATYKRTVDNLATDVLETYIAMMTASAAKKADEVVLDPELAALNAYYTHFSLYQQFTTNGASIHVRQSMPTFPTFGPLEEPAVRKAESAFLSKELQRFGGVEGLFLTLLKDADAAAGYQKLLGLLQDTNYLKGRGASGKPFTLSARDITVIKANGKKYFDALPAAFLKWQMIVLNGDEFFSPKVAKGALSVDLAKAKASLAKEALYATTGETIEADIALPAAGAGGGSKHVKLPVWRFTPALRAQGAWLVGNSASGEELSYLLAERTALQGSFNEMIMTNFGVDLATLQSVAPTLPKEVGEWVLQASAVFGAFQSPPAF